MIRGIERVVTQTTRTLSEKQQDQLVEALKLLVVNGWIKDGKLTRECKGHAKLLEETATLIATTKERWHIGGN